MFVLPPPDALLNLVVPGTHGEHLRSGAPVVREATSEQLGLGDLSILDSNGARWRVSFAEIEQSKGWDVKLKFEDLFKKAPNGEVDLDNNVKAALKELEPLHPFFRLGLQAVRDRGFKFELYDPKSLTLSAEIKDMFEKSSVEAMTLLEQGRVILKLKTENMPLGGSSIEAFIGQIGCELSHVINYRTYSRYEDPKEAFKNIKSIAEREQRQDMSLSSAEELLFRTAGQEILGHVVSKELLELMRDSNHKIDTGQFSLKSQDFLARSERWLALVFSSMWGKEVLEAIQSEKSPYPEIISDGEIKLFKSRLARNIVEGPIREQLIRDLKSFRFALKE